MNNRNVRITIRVVFGVLTLLLMGAIYLFSSQNADSSARTSGVVAGWLLKQIYPRYLHLSKAGQAGALHVMQLIVRKAAHFTEYTLLAAAFRQFLWTFRRIRFPGLLAWGTATLYAASDEIHQLFVEGRGGQMQDVLIDSAGALFGVFLAAAVTALAAQHLQKKQI